MKRPARLQTRLILAYLLVTLLPLIATLWVSIELLNRSLDLNSVHEFDRMSRSYETLAREFYRQSRDRLREDIARGEARPEMFALAGRSSWPRAVADFWDSGEPEGVETAGTDGSRIVIYQKRENGVAAYSRDLGGVRMGRLARQFTESREAIDRVQHRDFRRGFIWALVAVSGGIWGAGLTALVLQARRIAKPVHELTGAMGAVARGDMSVRLEPGRDDEIGRAMRAFNEMTRELQQSREKLIQMTRLASWQALARKTAHEVKNSLTPIRLTMEEIIASRDVSADPFLTQAAQIVVDEVASLEKRVRAFSEFAAEPPVEPQPVDLNVAVEDRVALLRSANAAVTYEIRLSPERPTALADPDLVKGVLTNLLENAAHAAGPGGVVLVKTAAGGGQAVVEVNDSGPGLSTQARATIFEPTISFKKGGMGLGLSIARKSAVLCGGDIQLTEGELGGAAFRVLLPDARQGAA